MAAGVNREAGNLLANAAGQRVKQLQALDFVIKQLHADGHFAVLSRENVDGVAPHPESAAAEIHVIALVLHAHQLGNNVSLTQLVADAQRHHHLVIALRFADTVDRRHCGHDDHIPPLQQALGAREAHLLDVLVDRAVLFNKEVTLRHVGFGLVVVVVTDEIFHRILGEELAKLAVKLCCQRFVGRKHNGRTPQTRNHVGHGEGLARAGHAEQGLEHFTVFHTTHQLADSLRLVTGRRIRLVQLERRIGIAHKRSRTHLFGIVGYCGGGLRERHGGRLQRGKGGTVD